MSSQDTIRVQGTVVEQLPNKLYRVELPNRHRLLAYVPQRLRAVVSLQPGQTVTVEVSPFDFSTGRIAQS